MARRETRGAKGGSTAPATGDPQSDTTKLEQAREYEARYKRQNKELPYTPFDLSTLVPMSKYKYWGPKQYKGKSMHEIKDDNVLKFLHYAQGWDPEEGTSLVSWLCYMLLYLLHINY